MHKHSDATQTRPLWQLADAVGCDRRSVARARDSGRLPAEFFVRRGKAQKLRADCFELAMQVMADGLYGRLSADDGQPCGISAARARREFYRAEFARLRVFERRGDMLPAQAVRQAVGDSVETTRQRLLHIPRQLAAELSSVSTEEAKRLLDDAIQAALAELHRPEVSGVRLYAPS